jgi:hypothetical protein
MDRRSGLGRRSKPCSPFATHAVSSPRISLSQLLYAAILSAASTAATESSKSMIVVTADSITTSLMPATTSLPMGLSRSISRITPSPWLVSSTLCGASGSPV